MFGLVVRFDVKPGSVTEFDALAAATLEQIRISEPGTLIYGCHEVAGEPNARVFYELYADRQAFDAHEQTPHVRHFLQRRGGHLSAPPRVEFFNSFEGKGLPT